MIYKFLQLMPTRTVTKLVSDGTSAQRLQYYCSKMVMYSICENAVQTPADVVARPFTCGNSECLMERPSLSRFNNTRVTARTGQRVRKQEHGALHVLFTGDVVWEFHSCLTEWRRGSIAYWSLSNILSFQEADSTRRHANPLTLQQRRSRYHFKLRL